ncbi:TolC family protein [Arcicella rosea]|uniref:Outer membrane protein TolC n=1 Tax=Arcicella rosea TaxID=502909 RepID=A0A841ESE5_9BACT|nr:TolC family protein [Arcicella rosea]MBB6003598.1 outer membrane protein TolC [Arcicella rosea]
MVWLKKNMFRIVLFFIIGMNTLEVNAQTVSTDILMAKALESEDFLVLLIESAIQFSPQTKKGLAAVEVANANLKVSKNALYSGIAASSSYNYGTNYSAVNNPTGVIPGANSFTTSQTGFYNVGIGVQLPLISVLNRKHIIKAGQAQINSALAEQENVNLTIKQEVIGRFQALKLAKKILALSTSNLQSVESSFIIAEKQFAQNQIGVDEQAKVLESYNKAKIEYETSLNTFQTVFMQLEAFVGVNLSTLLQQIK